MRAGKPGAAPSFKMASYVFSTFCGLRPAEPCSLTVVATHELLTQVLLYLMYPARVSPISPPYLAHISPISPQVLLYLMYSARVYAPEHPELCASSFDLEEVRE